MKEGRGASEIELRTDLDQAPGKNLKNVLPGGAVAVVDSQHAVRVEQVQEIDRDVRARAADVEQLANAKIDLIDAVGYSRPGNNRLTC